MEQSGRDNEVRAREEESSIARPNPVNWVRLKEFSAEHRNIYCVSYERCLDKAIEQDWQGWSCCECGRREEG